MDLRKHQAKAKRIADEILGGNDSNIHCAFVTPGGGKTLMCSIFAQDLITGGDVDFVMILCPRDSLQVQMRDGFTVPELGLKHQIKVGVPARVRRPNEQGNLDGSRNVGFVTTYQYAATGTNSARMQRLMSSGRWLLVLDESHHLPALESAENASWTKAVAPLVAKAKRTLLMSGTMNRGDRSQLAFVAYDDQRRAVTDISYTRREALEEKAVLPVLVKLSNGVASYWHRYTSHNHELSLVPTAEASRALRTMLNDEGYRNTMLSEAIEEWATYRVDRNPGSRMLVVCDSIKASNHVAKHIRTKHPEWKVVVATSKNAEGDENSTRAKRELHAFRTQKDGHILVTVQMAYEGLDVPDLTHLVCLTNIRERSWLEQAFSRATRFDREAHRRHGLTWEKQRAFFYVPSDPNMLAFFNEWLDEQDATFDDPSSSGAASSVPTGKTTFIPESGRLTGRFFGDENGLWSDADQRRVRAFEARHQTAAARMTLDEKRNVARDIWKNDSDIPEVSVEEAAAE